MNLNMWIISGCHRKAAQEIFGTQEKKDFLNTEEVAGYSALPGAQPQSASLENFFSSFKLESQKHLRKEYWKRQEEVSCLEGGSCFFDLYFTIILT